MFTLYKSSAGSGKTFTLVKEYLKLCLTDPRQYSRILAITFTNKAAAEMKTRIIDSIHRFLDDGHDPIIDLAIKDSEFSPDEARINAVKMRDSILHSYSDFSVMTIDSFISRIVRTFARDLDMPLKFDVELDTGYITQEIIERLMAEARKGNFLGDVLTEFAISKIHSSGSWSIDKELGKMGSVTFNEKYMREVSAISDGALDDAFWRHLIRDIDMQVQGFRSHINGLAREALSIIESEGLTAEDFAHGKSGAAGALQGYAKASTLKEFEIKKRLAAGKWMTKSTSPEIRHKIETALSNGLERLAAEIIDFIQTQRPRFISHLLIQKNIYSEALISRFIQLVEVYKTETKSVPLSDFARKVSRVVVDDPVPFLYWRLGNQYSHILIDEFQDTSALQWINLWPLVEESLARDGFNLAVGDGKQAIYRWRAGDVNIMERELPAVLGDRLQSEALSTNYRSRKEVVEFNNDLFNRLPDVLDTGEDTLFNQLYNSKAVRQTPVSSKTGYVKIGSVDFGEATRKPEKQAVILSRLVEDIQSILAEDNGYALRDMAVLVRNNSDAETVAQSLFEQGIEVISPGSLMLKSSAVVRFVISALRYAALDDRISLFNMWLFMGRDVAEFERLASTHSGQKEIEQALSGRFAGRKRFLVQLPAYEAVEEVIEIFGLNQRYHGFLQGLLEQVLNVSEKFSSNIIDFLNWWDQYSSTDKATLSSGEQAQAVTLSTIHKSKGLEFPIVFLPFAWEIVDSAGPGKSNFLWVISDQIGSSGKAFPYMVDVQKSLKESFFAEAYAEEETLSRLDNINLLYVALTRAADRLYGYVAELTTESDEKESLKNSAQLLGSCVNRMPLRLEEDGSVLGAPSPRDMAIDQSATETLRALPCHGWRRKIAVKKRAHELWRLEESDLKKKVDRGVLVHEILAAIETVDDIDGAVEEAFRLGHLASEEKAELAGLLHGVMNIPVGSDLATVGDWFTPRWTVKNEMAIASDKGEYRPDRVIIDGMRAVVIDYKTGRKMDEHHKQVSEYGDLLTAMGYSPVDKYLLYLGHREVEAV